MTAIEQERQVVSRKRVIDHGEVYTAKREVNAMLNLVERETERIESRFLEPACGTGNFLSEILARKLSVVESRYGKVQLEYERNSIIAVSSIYGIDILENNVIECRNRLLESFNNAYTTLYKADAREECRNAARYILERNILCGDALTLNTVDTNPQPIVFSEWSTVNGSMVKRRDFAFHELLAHQYMKQLPLFSDLGDEVFVATPIKEFPLVHFLKVADA